jgi:hypothetical protein
MTLAAALTRLATWSVTGVTTHYAYNAMPIVIPEAQLPALVVDFPEGGGYESINVALTSGILRVRVDHILLVAGEGLGLPLDRNTNTITLIDNYFAKVITDATLNSNLADGLKISTIQMGGLEYGGVLYQGIIFPHLWEIVY